MPKTDTLPSFFELNLRQLWRDFSAEAGSYTRASSQRRGFLRFVAKQTRHPEYVVDGVVFCTDCYFPEFADHVNSTANGGTVCSHCVGNYIACSDCRGLMSYRQRLITLHNTSVCARCAERYGWCDDCDGYYHQNVALDHDHGGAGCCESPALNFTLRNNGHDPLAQDTRAKVTLPAGEISAEGLAGISQEVRNMFYYESDPVVRRKWRDLSYQLEPLGVDWQNKDGNYAKRVSKLAYKQFSLKVPPKLMTAIGNIARVHSHRVDFSIELTRQFNLSASDFGNEESCLWQSYFQGRCALKTNGGFAIRSFNGAYVSGRAMVLPLMKNKHNQFTPTFDTRNAVAFVVFNGYGDMEGYIPARILSYMLGMTYRKVEFFCEPIYINSNAGYLVGAEEIVSPLTDRSIELTLEQHSNLFDREKKELVNA